MARRAHPPLVALDLQPATQPPTTNGLSLIFTNYEPEKKRRKVETNPLRIAVMLGGSGLSSDLNAINFLVRTIELLYSNIYATQLDTNLKDLKTHQIRHILKGPCLLSITIDSHWLLS